nr:hypothetical protein [Tanacetum cinerariifolium]
MDSIIEDSVDEDNLVDLNDNLVDTMHEMFIEEHALDYSSPPEKIKESKILIDELDLPSDFLPSSEYDSFLFKDFSKNEKKLAISHASLMLEDFNPPLYELPFFKEVPGNLRVFETKGPRVSILVSVGCQKPGHLATRLGCAETKVVTWDDLAFKLITLG